MVIPNRYVADFRSLICLYLLQGIFYCSYYCTNKSRRDFAHFDPAPIKVFSSRNAQIYGMANKKGG